MVSVIIPCHNQGRFLAEAIDSAQAQTCRDVEIVVIDDGSTDHTPAVLVGYPAVRSIRQDNRGLAAARNIGLHASGGAHVVFLDADDRLRPDALDAEVASLRANPDCGFVYGHVRLIDTHGTALPPLPPARCVDTDHYAALLRRNYVWTAGAAMYRRDVLDVVGGFDSRVSPSADFDLNLRVARRYGVRCLDRVVLDYRVHGANMSLDSTAMLTSSLVVLRSQRAHVKGNGRYEAALREGIRLLREDYGSRLGREVQRSIATRQWRHAALGAWVLVRSHPSGVVKYGLQKLLFALAAAARRRPRVQH